MSQNEEEEALWVSCLVCDAMPGDRCKAVETVDQLVHPERIENMKRLEEDP